MTFSSCLSEADRSLVLDTSVVINLLATAQPIRILEALGRPVIVPDIVVREVDEGERSERRQRQLLDDLIQGQAVDIVPLGDDAAQLFAGLVSGQAAESLGDGEAATIALAVTRQASAVIDEKKATKLCAARHSTLRLATTVDLLGYAAVEQALGRPALSTSLLGALLSARMQVRDHQFDWVAELIGDEGVAKCSSLRRLAKARAHQQRLRAVG